MAGRQTDRPAGGWAGVQSDKIRMGRIEISTDYTVRNFMVFNKLKEQYYHNVNNVFQSAF